MYVYILYIKVYILHFRFETQFLIDVEPIFISYNPADNSIDQSISPQRVILTGQYHFYSSK